MVNYGDVRFFIRFVVRCIERIIDEYLSVIIIYLVGYEKYLELIDVYDINSEDIFNVDKNL